MDNEDLSWILKEYEQIDNISDPEEKQKKMDELDRKLDERAELLSKEYERKRQEIFDDIISRGVKLQRNVASPKELKSRWEQTFAASLSKKEKKKIYIDSFLWHIFSYEKVKCQKNEEARKAFNEVDKESVIAFYEHNEDVLFFENAQLLMDADFDMEQDIYIVDYNFKWTYAVTHEKEQCGPYFFMIEKQV